MEFANSSPGCFNAGALRVPKRRRRARWAGVPKRRRRARWAGVPKRRRRGRWAGVLSAAGAAYGSQGQVRAQRARCPWITNKKRASPAGATVTLARFCRPSRPVFLFSNVPGATRFALTPGYLLPRLRRSNDHAPDQDDSCSRPGLMLPTRINDVRAGGALGFRSAAGAADGSQGRARSA
jgi:hypothetical protein